MFVRVGAADTDQSTADAAVQAYRTVVVPDVQELDGFLGTFAAIDRSTGRILAVTLWRDADAMEASEQHAPRFIADARAASGAPAPKVDRYEVVYWNVDLDRVADAT
jgi:hypothetical protein